MNEVRVRLIFHDSLGTRERLAALTGAREFAKFGVICDCADTGKRNAADGIMRGDAIVKMITSGKVVVGAADLGHEPILSFFFKKERSIFGLGITPYQLGLAGENGAVNGSLGVSRPGAAGVVSAWMMMKTGGDLGGKAISAAVRHELGHIFGITPHCTDEKCIMQANHDYADFIERFVKLGLDFCRECQAKISAGVGRAMLP